MKKASIVLGLGFGDEGKGLTVDYLCSKDPDTIVVRFSGGQQAGHNVIYNGRQHVHSSFGSGTLRGVPTFISEHCTFYLNSIQKEVEKLKEISIYEPRLYVHPLANVTTPYDVAYGRVRELICNHGSCGLGIGTTMNRQNSTGYKLYAIDLKYPDLMREKLSRIGNYYGTLIGKDMFTAYQEIVDIELPIFLQAIENNPVDIADYTILNGYENVVFEGSQGIMLDKDHGVFPNVTYANTTSKNAIEICKKIDVRPKIYYVTRCYQTRHGRGWMSNTEFIDIVNNRQEINVYNDWQKEFVTSELDYELLNHAIDIDRLYCDNNSSHLVVTCMDQRIGFAFDYDKIKFPFKSYLTSHSPESKDIVDHGQIKKKISSAGYKFSGV